MEQIIVAETNINPIRTHASTAMAFRDASYACPITHYRRGGWMMRMCRFFCGEAR